MIRATELYTLIAQAEDGYLLDDKVPKALRASASIAQTVETAVLRDACNWLGIDPDVDVMKLEKPPLLVKLSS